MQYRPGQQSNLPDALSQQPELPTDIRPCSDASLLAIVLQLSLLTKVHQGSQSDITCSPYIQKEKSSESEFIMRQVHGISLVYHCPKPDVYQLIRPGGWDLHQFLLEETHCTPLAGHMGACKIIAGL